MQQVLIDTCGWVAVVDAKINIDLALINEIGPFQLRLLPAVNHELKRLSNERKNQLLMSLLETKALEILPLDKADPHTDDQLFRLSKKYRWPILTIDRGLKIRLSSAGLPWIEVKGHNRLNLIDNHGSVNKSSSP